MAKDSGKAYVGSGTGFWLFELIKSKDTAYDAVMSSIFLEQ